MYQLQVLQTEHWQTLLKFELDNQQWFEKWIEPRSKGFYQRQNFLQNIKNLVRQRPDADYAMYLLLDAKNILGRFNIINIEQKKAEIGYRLAERATGKGIATTGLQALMVEAKNKLKLQQLTARVAIDNIASQKVLLNNGFVQQQSADNYVLVNAVEIEILHFSVQL
ncbi:MAG: GNAT family N-acetyltransferase [Pseudomonadales bacterium]|nr:GNAT family N-acetyltransferase [Pseudomonadales bacterium]